MTSTIAASEASKNATSPEQNAAFMREYLEYKKRFLKLDHSDALDADGPFEIFGGNCVNGKNTHTQGQIYRTKDKKVLVVFFPGIARYDPPGFGHVVMLSSGGANSTIKTEIPEDSITNMLPTLSEATRIDSKIKDATKYHEIFLQNVAVECRFGMGMYIPNLFEKPFVVAIEPAPPQGEGEGKGEGEDLGNAKASIETASPRNQGQEEKRVEELEDEDEEEEKEKEKEKEKEDQN